MSNKVQKLIDFISRLPGIGPRQATRLVLSLIDWDKRDLENLAETLVDLKNGPLLCQTCFNFADDDVCKICANQRRDHNRIAVVEKVTDLSALEKAGVFNGVYHVLGGSINPAAGILPQKLKIEELLERIRNTSDRSKMEVILATNPTTNGETTALYLRDQLEPFGINITRLARGLPAGGSVEYSDQTTLAHALKYRK